MINYDGLSFAAAVNDINNGLPKGRSKCFDYEVCLDVVMGVLLCG